MADAMSNRGNARVTVRKYRRLFLVLLLPLLISGLFFLKTSGAWDERYSFILCSSEFDGENCRNVGPNIENSFYKEQRGRHFAWTDVSIPHSGSSITHEFVAISERLMPKLTVIEVGSLLNSEQISSYLTGKEIAIRFGINEKDNLAIYTSPIVLSCNMLNFFEDVTIFSAYCYGEGWGGEVKFTAAGSSAQQLSNIRFAITKAIDEHRSEYFLFSTLLILAPLVLFFLGSALVWVAIKATQYVRSG